MKKFFLQYTLPAATVFLLSGCNKMLDIQPTSSLTEENFYRNTTEIASGIVGCYNALLPLYNDNYVVVDLRSDDCYVSESEGDHNMIDGFTERSTNSYLDEFWKESYYVIKQANTIMQYLDNVTDETTRKNYEGEVKFLRAHMYFNLVRLWGDVPLVTGSVAYNDQTAYTRVNKDKIYQQIIADLKDASAKLPADWGGSQQSRVTNYAAKTLLAKVYLTLKDYANARTLLANVITTPGRFALQPSFRNVFGIGNETNNEIMYSVRFKSNANGLGEVYTYNYAKLTGSQNVRSAKDLTSLYATTDSVRKNATIVLDGTYNLCAKYLDAGAPVRDAGADYIVLRFADAVLMYAEVINELDGPTAEALAQLNLIRSRAGTTLYTAAQLSTQTSFRNAIKAERRIEFAWEGQRWFDLVRWGDAVTAMNASFIYLKKTNRIQDYQTLYPVPQREIDLSNGALGQNTGY